MPKAAAEAAEANVQAEQVKMAEVQILHVWTKSLTTFRMGELNGSELGGRKRACDEAIRKLKNSDDVPALLRALDEACPGLIDLPGAGVTSQVLKSHRRGRWEH